MSLLLSLIVGFLTGARTFAPLALVAWAAAFGWLDVGGTWMGWLGAPAPAAVLTLLALGELYGDKLPEAKERTAWYALAARLVFGALAGAAIALGAAATAAGPLGAVSGALGAAIGTFTTFRLRGWLIERAGRIPAALIEDALVIGGTALTILAATGGVKP